ncbi:MAG: aminotransferase class V-fold PLP-dependent enzyme [Pseudomonadota bacterium]|nr:aminotransferase class V-fold PLP-dependent enzyme [Pseudomonadota bacterium]
MSGQDPIYLDYAATTPVDERVAERMAACLTRQGVFGNPSSVSHCYGQRAAALVGEARAEVAALLGAEPAEVIFTSGATESNNLAILGIARFYAERGRHLITGVTEHKSVLAPFKALEAAGWEVTYLSPTASGAVSVEQLAEAFRPDTALVSLMHVNNETGVIQDIRALGEMCRERGVRFHVDAAQSVGKLPLDLSAMPLDSLALSAHKFYGPKGVGALFVRRRPRLRLRPVLHGGGQEGGLRPGTLATHQIVGLGEASRLARDVMASEQARIQALRDQLWRQLATLPGMLLNGEGSPRVSGILNVSVADVHGESLLAAIDDELAVAMGSACTSAVASPSYVLKALGRSDALANSSLRLSLGRFTSEEDIARTGAHLVSRIRWLRALSPSPGTVLTSS